MLGPDSNILRPSASTAQPAEDLRRELHDLGRDVGPDCLSALPPGDAEALKTLLVDALTLASNAERSALAGAADQARFDRLTQHGDALAGLLLRDSLPGAYGLFSGGGGAVRG